MAARIITIFGNKGGVGKTFIAVNIACALSLKGKKTLIVDLNLQASQDMSRMLNLQPSLCLVDILADLERSPETLKGKCIPHPSGLCFLPAVRTPQQIGHITSDNLRLFFKKAAPQFDCIIVDGGSTFSESFISVLDSSNLIFLVGTPDVLAVYQVKTCLDILQGLHYPLKMVNLILNRAESRGGVAWQEVKKALACDVFSLIPSDGKTVGLALNRGVPCVMDSPKAKVSECFFEIAHALNDDKLYVQASDVLRVRATGDESGQKSNAFWEKFGITPAGVDAGVDFKKEEDEVIKVKRAVHNGLVERMNLQKMSQEVLNDPAQVANLRRAAEKVVTELLAEASGTFLSTHEERAKIVKEIVDEALGLGPLEDFLADESVTDIMVNNKDEVFIEKNGKIYLTNKRFISNDQVRATIDRIIAPLGRRVDESTPMVDARLSDGSRINAIIPPLSLNGPMITVRKFSQDRYTIEDLLTRFKSLSQPMADFLNACVIGRRNIVVSGGTGAGKTTLLNIISHFIPDNERIITIEDAAELRLVKTHWARLESRPANIEGRGKVTIRELFVNTLRMRPDRIIIGECRGPEVLDMLQAMNTGHDGSLTTLHANTTRDTLSRMSSMVLLSGIELPLRAIYEMAASAIHIIVQINRFSDGSRKVTQISELTGKMVEGLPEIKDIFVFVQKGVDAEGRNMGEYAATGYVPKCFEDLTTRGISISKTIFEAPAGV
ncbi:MAG: Flp pilus assembly complex ATPase component TadA [Candidatus Omnitrophica bacterium]|nr:Flp pilus assembly complex ATPase component TadA [Candidatus Omnitrophota bacterium]MDE2214568.1 Flp pilus assembly complex ATPase component TadA [Candidatus Omnitrophota bacterium]MDE2231645.1 Flp pilus assembly complex ATPase component TadA [Candidatus Omnitrophota bacterium]